MWCWMGKHIYPLGLSQLDSAFGKVFAVVTFAVATVAISLICLLKLTRSSLNFSSIFMVAILRSTIWLSMLLNVFSGMLRVLEPLFGYSAVQPAVGELFGASGS